MMKATAAKKYRRLAMEAVLAAFPEGDTELYPWGVAGVKATFFYSNHRKRDQDNAIASLKAAYDGIVDSGLVEDDDYEHMKRESPAFLLDKNNPCVILEITQLS